MLREMHKVRNNIHVYKDAYKIQAREKNKNSDQRQTLKFSPGSLLKIHVPHSGRSSETPCQVFHMSHRENQTSYNQTIAHEEVEIKI
jgi:hypothetical protein